MFISPAFAQAAGASPQDSLTTFVLPMDVGPVHHPLMARRLPWAYGETCVTK